ncbi:MAG: hypothetical protein EA364_14645 [Balneolaceae bacterium]|nr:MAG: hypothetical protein EA364_14645 [Balneolaceae bacterium]
MKMNANRSFLIPALISLGMVLSIFHFHVSETTGHRIDHHTSSGHEFCAICYFTGKAGATGIIDVFTSDRPEVHFIVIREEPYSGSASASFNLRAPPFTR